MADITASTALRDYIAGHLQGSYYFATLHTATTGITAASVYAATGLSEVPTDTIYTLGGVEVTSTEVDGVSRIYTGRPSFLQGAHERKLNRTHLSICVVGNYDETELPEDLFLATVRACIGLMVLNPQIKPRDVVFHSDFSYKTCPGTLFPRERLLNVVESVSCEIFENCTDPRPFIDLL